MPERYREMRKLATGYVGYNSFDAMIFLRQAKFMEEFEDDFDYDGNFAHYFPTYQTMNDRQLRGYFSWRTRLRHGEITRTSLSFAFVYVYELLHRIGVPSPEAGFHTLKNFWTAYREFDTGLDRYLKLWLKDYVIYHHLDPSLLAALPEPDSDRALLTLLQCRSHSPEEVFTALCSLSSYRLEKSGFYRLHPETVQQVVHSVFSELSAYYHLDNRNGLGERLFGKNYVSAYYMFRGAVFHEPIRPPDQSYIVSDIDKYHCRNGNWSCERFVHYKEKTQQIGALLKLIDCLLRRHYNFKPALKVEKAPKLYLELIHRELEKHRQARRQNALASVTIDVSRLHAIRRSARDIQNKLIVEEPEPEPEIAPAPAPEPEDHGNLTTPEYRLLQCLLYHRDYGEVVKSHGMMLSVVVDAVNEKLLETFGDTVIVYEGDKPELIADYIEELKGIVKQ